MKKTLLIAACAASFSAHALPTYEPFTEATFVNAIAAGGSNAVDLATGGYSAPTGELWGDLNWSGTRGTGLQGLDILVTNNPGLFTSNVLSALLPPTFPGMPAPGQSITNVLMNPAQPLVGGVTSPNIIGNSAVLIFNTDITRPTTGTKTLYISYLWSLDLGTALGAGNDARYLAFVAQSNTTAPGGLPTWETMLDTIPGSYPNATHAVTTAGTPSGDNFIIGPCDNTVSLEYSSIPASGKSGSVTPFGQKYATPMFVVGCITLTPASQKTYTNTLWVNPATSLFGGPTPPTTFVVNDAVTVTTQQLSDVGGMIVEDRPGSGASHGGLGSNFMANILVGTTWSYVTGGPEFTNQPPANTLVLGNGTLTVTGQATAAAQGVTYQWQKIVGGSPTNLTDGVGTAGGTATVTGSLTSTLSLSGQDAADFGTYQVVATASGTGYTLTSSQSALVQVTDPFINPQPSPVTVNYGGNASFSATGSGSVGPMSYQWYNGTTPLTNGTLPDGCTISGASGTAAGTSVPTTLSLARVTYLERGNYILWVTNGNNATISSTPATLAVNDPYVVTQQSTSNVVQSYGTSLTSLTFVANGSSVSYLWYKSGSGAVGNAGDITGATTTNIQFSALTFGDAGTYYAVASGPGGSVTSSVVAITVEPITIEPPTAVTVAPGGFTNITVHVAGSGLSFQWQNTNGNPVSADFLGATTTNLIITNAQASDQGTYNVIVTYPNGTETTTPVLLYVQAIQLGPFPTNTWPPTVQNTSQITYAILDPNAATDDPALASSVPSSWVNSISLPASAGDQTWTSTTYNGFTGDTMTGTYFNPADTQWQRFASYPIIDVLIQVYGDPSMYTSSNTSVSFEWSYGQAWQGYYYSKHYTFPLGANNDQWNWMLLEITNVPDAPPYDITASPANIVSGDYFCGDPGIGEPASTYGGINNGTLRMDGFNTTGPTFTIRAVALGPQGAFGTPNEINRFVVPANCAAEPATNLVYVDFNQGITDNLTVNNNAGDEETYQTVTGGPPDDQRTAIQATSQFMEFPILNNALGLPCNGDFTMQICMEFYDDPALAGESFGPYAYATDPYGDIGFVPGYPGNYNQAFYTLTGTGRWLKVDWFVGPANLVGLNTFPLTGGPLVYWGLAGAPPLVDRIELGVIQTGTNALAGQTPDASYNIDPFICDGTNNATGYNTNGYYAEWNPTGGVQNNLTPASGYTTTVTGPANDQRTAEVPNPAGGGSAYYEQFALLNDVFGPLLQDNSDVAMIVTYYDDPAIAGTELFINTIQSLQNGSVTTQNPSSGTYYIVTQGTGKWVDAYLEVSGVNFSSTASIAGTPNFVCRYASYNPVYISRVRYDVIRPCGQYEGIDYLQGTVGITKTNPGVTLNWRGTATLQGSPVVAGAYTNVAAITNTVSNYYPVPTASQAKYFRLQFPSYPTNLSTYTPSP